MPIKADRSGVPSVPSTDDELAPDTDDTFLRTALATYLDVAEPVDDELELAIPEAGPIRGSYAGKCARAISYSILEPERAAPFDMGSRWNFALGTAIHELLQKATAAVGWRSEVDVDLNPIGVPGSAHLDLLGADTKGRSVAVEIKSINGTGFKQAATKDRGPATGPRIAHLLQGGLAALALGVDALRIVYVSKENAAAWHIDRHGYNPDSPIAGFGAQWTIPLDKITARIEREARRLAKIAALAEKKKLAPRAVVDEDVPASATIVDPAKGAWQVTDDDGMILSVGTTWQCGYCQFQAACLADLEAGR